MRFWYRANLCFAVACTSSTRSRWRCMASSFLYSFFARSSPATSVSYSASLFVVGKSNQIMHSILSPSRVWITTPAPSARLLEDPFVWMLHYMRASTSLPSDWANSTMKSATAYPFIAVHGRYCIPNSLSFITHKAICSATSGLLMALLKGWSVKTMIVYAWKYGLSFRVIVTSANANFSIWGYLSSAPWNARFIK